MDDQRLARIQQLRETMRRDRRSLLITVVLAIIGYIVAASRGSMAEGWIAFVFAVAASFGAVIITVALASYELEANLLEGPRTG